MKYPISTGQSARLLGVGEPRLNGLIRKGRLDPEPLVSAGRRQWEAGHLLQAAEVLGVLTGDLRRRLEEDDVVEGQAHRE